jgi:hypothetical protein
MMQNKPAAQIMPLEKEDRLEDQRGQLCMNWSAVLTGLA